MNTPLTPWRRLFFAFFLKFSVCLFGAVVPCVFITAGHAIAAEVAKDPEADPKAAQAIEQGNAFFKQRQFDQALELYEQALRFQPDSPEAFFRIGAIHIEKADYARGLEYLRRAVTLAPTNLSLGLTYAQTLDRLGQYDQAISVYHDLKALQLEEDQKREIDKRLSRAIAQEFIRDDNYFAANQVVQELMVQHRRDIEIWKMGGVIALELGRYEEAERIILHAITVRREDPTLYLQLAKIYDRADKLWDLLDTLDLVVVYDRLGAVRKQAAAIALERARKYMLTGDLSNAVKVLDWLVGIDPTNVIASLSSAATYEQLGFLQQAEFAYQRILDQNPRSIDAYFRLGTLYAKQNKINQAIPMFAAVRGLGKKSVLFDRAGEILGRVFAQRGQAAVNKKNANDALFFLNQALVYDPENINAHNLLGFLYFSGRKYAEAREHLEKVLRVDPNRTKVYLMLASIYDTLELLDEAANAYSMVIVTSPEGDKVDPYVYKLRLITAKMFIKDKRYEAAIEQLKELREENPEDDKVMYRLAVVYSTIGQLDSAIELYEGVIKINPRNFLARFSLGVLYEQNELEEQALEQYRFILKFPLSAAIIDRAEERFKAVSKVVNGFSYNITYGMRVEDNANLDDNDPASEYRTNFSFGLTYRYKYSQNIRLRSTVQSNYSTSHIGEFDSLSTTFTSSVTLGRGSRKLDLGFSLGNNENLLFESPVSNSTSYFSTARLKHKLPRFLGLAVGAWRQGDVVNGSSSINLSISRLQSEINDIFDAKNFNFGYSLGISAATALSTNFSYAFSRSENTHPLGNDRAYESNSFTLSFSRSLISKVIGSISYSYAVFDYLNPDSVTNFQAKRFNEQHRVNVDLTYLLHSSMYVTLGYSRVDNSTNLPVRERLSAQDIALAPLTAVDLVQSKSLGNYSNNQINLTMTFRF